MNLSLTWSSGFDLADLCFFSRQIIRQTGLGISVASDLLCDLSQVTFSLYPLVSSSVKWA